MLIPRYLYSPAPGTVAPAGSGAPQGERVGGPPARADATQAEGHAWSRGLARQVAAGTGEPRSRWLSARYDAQAAGRWALKALGALVGAPVVAALGLAALVPGTLLLCAARAADRSMARREKAAEERFKASPAGQGLLESLRASAQPSVFGPDRDAIVSRLVRHAQETGKPLDRAEIDRLVAVGEGVARRLDQGGEPPPATPYTAKALSWFLYARAAQKQLEREASVEPLAQARADFAAKVKAADDRADAATARKDGIESQLESIRQRLADPGLGHFNREPLQAQQQRLRAQLPPLEREIAKANEEGHEFRVAMGHCETEIAARTAFSDLPSDGALVIDDPDSRLHRFLESVPTAADRMSSHVRELSDSRRMHRILGVVPAFAPAQCGIEDYQSTLPGAGGAVMCDKLKPAEPGGPPRLYVKFEPVGCPAYFLSRHQESMGDRLVRMFAALSRNSDHSVNFAQTRGDAPGAGRKADSRPEHVYKGPLRQRVGDPFKALVGQAIRQGALGGDARAMASSMKTYGLPFVVDATVKLRDRALQLQREMEVNTDPDVRARAPGMRQLADDCQALLQTIYREVPGLQGDAVAGMARGGEVRLGTVKWPPPQPAPA